MRRPLFGFILLAALLAPSAAGLAEDWPTLRRLNYAALLGNAGKELRLQARSVQHTRLYGEELNYILYDCDGNEIASGGTPLNTSATIAATPKTDGLCALELDSGWNICFFDSGETPSAYVASEMVPLQTIREIERLYFYVPKDCKRFSIGVSASVTGEGARIVVFAPDGQTVKEQEGDFDKREQIKVDVPAGADGKAWSLSVAKPGAPKLYVDDVELSLDPALPPYLSKRAEWAVLFGQRKHQ
jgi:hypothetical protein